MSIVTLVSKIDILMTNLKTSDNTVVIDFSSQRAYKACNKLTIMGDIIENKDAEGNIMSRKIDGSFVYACVMEYIATQEEEGKGRYLYFY